mgnify:CR=1 FL=1|tara:strand:- start:1048 stop:1632 length:585 start_codon:yes stop_codon:yes gene_type:complete
MKFEIFKYETVTSTNDIAMFLIKDKKKESGCIYADEQTKGRGTHGKNWESKSGNLFLSIFFQLKESYPRFDEFSIINPVIVSNVIKNLCKNKDINIKWPNDIFISRKKVCGILQEQITFNKNFFLIIGVGINLVSNPRNNIKYESTNIFLETEKKHSINEIVKLIILSYERFFSNLNSYNYKNFIKEAESMVLN